MPAHRTVKFVLNEIQSVLFNVSHGAVKWVASAAAVQERCRPLYGEQSGDTDSSPHIEAGLKGTHRKESKKDKGKVFPENIKTSAKESLGLHELKQHKP